MVREAAKLAVRHAELHQALAQNDWKSGIFALPLREIRAQWQAAQAKWALPRSLALSKLRKILAAEANGALSGECLEDLDRLVEINAITAAIQAIAGRRPLRCCARSLPRDDGRCCKQICQT